MALKLFVDTNVYLDFLMHRGTQWQDAQSIFELAELGKIEVYTSASSLINIMRPLQDKGIFISIFTCNN